MKKNSAIALVKITSCKSLERQLVAASKLFQGKETEFNWEEREQTLQLLDSLLSHESYEEWKNIIIQGIHNLVFGIADATQSLRTKYAMVAFDLIKHIGVVTGAQLDATTFETLFTGLLRCVNTSKQLVANKAKDTMISFISTTCYHNKAITLLCLALDDRNAQSRHLVALYMNTYLQRHAPNSLVRESMGYLNTLKKVELFLKTGLLDATPAVRQTCSSTFWIYHKYWPANGDRLLVSFDATTRKQLEKKSSIYGHENKQNTLGKRSIPLATNGQPKLKRSLDLSPKRKRQSLKESPTPALASASLLHMLRSKDTAINCDGLCILAKRLTTRHDSNPSHEMVLPATVPRRADLTPILWNYLSPDRLEKDQAICNQLMSWDCLSGIFVHVFSLHQFLPGMILAGQRHCRGTVTTPQYHSTCALGLKRLKLYLKYNNKDLMKHLIDILLMTTTYGGVGLRDPNATRELRDDTTDGKKARDDLVYELVNWMDELVCGHIGLNDDENDHDVIKQCDQQWTLDVLSSTTLGVATEWIADNDNLELCLSSILRVLKSYASVTSSVIFTCLINLVGRLRLVNARIFNMVVEQSEEDVILLLDTCLGRQHSLDQRIMQDGKDTDPPPPYDDITVCSPPSWSGIPQDDLSLDSEDIGLENTLLDEDDYDILDTSLEDMPPFDTSEVNDITSAAHVTDMDSTTETSGTDEFSTVTTSILTGNEKISNRKDALVDAIYQLTITCDNKLHALQTLESLCARYSTKEGTNGKIWMDTKHFDYDGSLLEYLISHLTEGLQQSQPQQLTLAILRLLKMLLIHQGNLLQQDDNTTHDLALTLLQAKVEKYGRVPSMVDDVLDTMLATMDVEVCTESVARLLKQQFTTNSTTQDLSTVTLFNRIAKLTPRLSTDLLKEFMEGCSGYFEQGINHSTVSIRQSCVSALVELATVDHDIKKYLPNLRKEQDALLDHYIGLKKTT